MSTCDPTTYNPTRSAEVTFLPLADPERREKDPLRALQAARDLRILLSLGELGAVRHARLARRSWAEIGDALGITRQAAQQRFGILVDLADGAEDHDLDDLCLYCGDPHQDGPCRILEQPVDL
jgi:hypothetical protein